MGGAQHSADSSVEAIHCSKLCVTGQTCQPMVVEPVAGHGSSEGHEMLKRNDKYHSIADDVPIPKM